MKKPILIYAALIFKILTNTLPAAPGAAVPWITYEAEDMKTTGYVSDLEFIPGWFATGCSGRRGVQLSDANQFVEFTATQGADALVVRYGVPDTSDGTGADYTLNLYTNGVFAKALALTSKYSWLYGSYPFANTPGLGAPRNLFDEVRLKMAIAPGEVLRLQKDPSNTADYYNIDLVDLETVPSPLNPAASSLSILAYGADPTGVSDSTAALNNCIGAALSLGKTVWVPGGTYKITSTINLPSNVSLQGAGMWHTTFVGDPALYLNQSRRVTFNGNGNNIHLSDFAIVGKLNYRNDSEPNDGLGGSYGAGSTLSRIWVEHTKTGAWIVNSLGLIVDGCRFRDTIADGINLAVGMRGTLVTNCTARGTGDDCFAIWPATYMAQNYTPGLNVFSHCTGLAPFLANCGAIYGGVSNAIQDCLFQDSGSGCGVLISTTFPVGANVFSGVTTVERTDLNRCGGEDYNGGLNGSFLLYLNNSSLAGINIRNVNIKNNCCDGLDVIAPGSNPSSGLGTLSNAIISNVTIPDYGIAFGGSDALWADSSALGKMVVSNSAIVDVQNFSSHFTFLFTNTVSQITAMSVAPDGQVTLKYTATPGRLCHLESSTNLTGNYWETVPGSIALAGQPVVTFLDTNPQKPAQRYYRSVLP